MMNNSNYTMRGAAAVLLLAAAAIVSGCGGPQAREARYERRGQEYLAKGQYDKAGLEFRNALQIAPNNANLRYDNGLVAEKLGDVRSAAAFYTGAIDANKDHIQARVSLGRLLIFAGLTDRGLEQINPGLAAHPNNVDLLAVHSIALQQKGDPARALAEAQKAVALDPQNEGAVATLAGMETKLGQTEAAQKLVEEATKRLPDSIQLRKVLAQVYLDRKDGAGAERVLLSLIGLQPEQRVYRVQLAQLYAQLNRVDDAERTLRKAITDLPKDEDAKRSLIEFLWARRGRDVAEAQLKSMIAAAPADCELQFTLGNLYEMSGDGTKAEQEYHALIDKQGRGTVGLRARDRLASLYAGRNDFPGAQKLINEVLEQNPGDNDALALRAYDSLLRGDTQAAISDLRRVLRDQPGSTRLLNMLARAYIADGEPDLAEEAARRSVESDPSDVASRMELAQVLMGRGKFEDGRTILLQLKDQRPDDAQVLDLLCRADLALNDASEAQAIANDLVRLRPNWSLAYLYLGIVAESAGRTDEALASYRRSFELQPHAPDGLSAIAHLMERAKRFDEATAFLSEVAQKDPANALAPSLEGDVFLQQGDHLEQAEAAFKAALARAPKWWDAYRGLAYVQMARKNSRAAARVLQAASANAQLSEPQRLEFAGLSTGIGRPEEAIDQYETVLKKHPKSQVAAGGLAMLLVSYRTDQASFNRASGLVRPLAASTDWRLLDAFGWVQFKNDDLTAALPALEKAATQVQGSRGARPPDVAELRFHLGMAQLKAGQPETAEKNLAEAVANDAVFFGHDEAKAVLAKLRSRKS